MVLTKSEISQSHKGLLIIAFVVQTHYSQYSQNFQVACFYGIVHYLFCMETTISLSYYRFFLVIFMFSDSYSQAQNQNTSSCLLLELITTNTTVAGRYTLLQELCSQSKYDGLTTCLLFDFTTASKPVDFITVANATCQHHLIKQTSFCDVVEIQRRLLDILNDTDPREVLCRDNSTILVYSDDSLRSEVQGPMCNMTQQHLTLLLDTIVEHVNVTAVYQIYFPDGLELGLVYEVIEQVQELRSFPTVQVSLDGR